MEQESEERLPLLDESVPGPALSLSFSDIDTEPEKPSRNVLTVTALGGRRVVVVEENFRKLIEAAGIEVEGDLSHCEFGMVLSAAKDSNRRALLEDLLAVRCGVSPLYSIRNEQGRPWFSHSRPAQSIVNNKIGIEQESVVAP